MPKLHGKTCQRPVPPPLLASVVRAEVNASTGLRRQSRQRRPLHKTTHIKRDQNKNQVLTRSVKRKTKLDPISLDRINKGADVRGLHGVVLAEVFKGVLRLSRGGELGACRSPHPGRGSELTNQSKMMPIGSVRCTAPNNACLVSHTAACEGTPAAPPPNTS